MHGLSQGHTLSNADCEGYHIRFSTKLLWWAVLSLDSWQDMWVQLKHAFRLCFSGLPPQVSVTVEANAIAEDHRCWHIPTVEEESRERMLTCHVTNWLDPCDLWILCICSLQLRFTGLKKKAEAHFFSCNNHEDQKHLYYVSTVGYFAFVNSSDDR